MSAVVHDNGELNGIEFTADEDARVWGLAGEDNWPALEEAAEKSGIPAKVF